jgi:hypothetical protein
MLYSISPVSRMSCSPSASLLMGWAATVAAAAGVEEVPAKTSWRLTTLWCLETLYWLKLWPALGQTQHRAKASWSEPPCSPKVNRNRRWNEQCASRTDEETNSSKCISEPVSWCLYSRCNNGAFQKLIVRNVYCVWEAVSGYLYSRCNNGEFHFSVGRNCPTSYWRKASFCRWTTSPSPLLRLIARPPNSLPERSHLLVIETSLSLRRRMTLGVELIFWFISHTLPQCLALRGVGDTYL